MDGAAASSGMAGAQGGPANQMASTCVSDTVSVNSTFFIAVAADERGK